MVMEEKEKVDGMENACWACTGSGWQAEEDQGGYVYGVKCEECDGSGKRLSTSPVTDEVD
jgi:DnaJ-class molecular chaperone